MGFKQVGEANFHGTKLPDLLVGFKVKILAMHLSNKRLTFKFTEFFFFVNISFSLRKVLKISTSKWLQTLAIWIQKWKLMKTGSPFSISSQACHFLEFINLFSSKCWSNCSLYIYFCFYRLTFFSKQDFCSNIWIRRKTFLQTFGTRFEATLLF